MLEDKWDRGRGGSTGRLRLGKEGHLEEVEDEKCGMWLDGGKLWHLYTHTHTRIHFWQLQICTDCLTFSDSGPPEELTIFISEALDRKATRSFCQITMAMRELFKNKKLLLRWVKYGKSKRPVPIWKRGGGSWKERVMWERLEGTENVCYIKPMSGKVSSL